MLNDSSLIHQDTYGVRKPKMESLFCQKAFKKREIKRQWVYLWYPDASQFIDAIKSRLNLNQTMIQAFMKQFSPETYVSK